MEKVTIQKAIILSGLLTICFILIIVLSINRTPEEKDKILSVRESLVPMFVTGLISNKDFPFDRINPDVREYILFYLDKDNSDYDFAANGIRLLGVVGRDEDIEFIDRYLQSRLNNIENNEKFRLLSPEIALLSGAFAGMMINRDIKGAEQFFQKYGQLSVWMPLEGTNLPYLGFAKQSYGSFIIGAYQFSMADYIRSLLRQKSSDSKTFINEQSIEVLEKMGTDLYTKLMKPSPTSESILKKNIDKYLNQYGDSIDMLLRKQTYAQWRKANLEK
jgi:hypothetical protein